MNKDKKNPEYEWINKREDTSIRYLEHGYPHELVRWHYHEEYELHLIKETKGKVFVGDYIGNFKPNSLILVGPNLPHNWISDIDKGEYIPLRDCVINFSEDIVSKLTDVFPEGQDLAPFWQRAKYGLEFDLEDKAELVAGLIKDISLSNGFKRLSLFIMVIEILSSLGKYRVLTSAQYVPIKDTRYLDSLNKVVTHIIDNYDTPLSQEDVAQFMQMSPSYFSKFFKKATGHRFIEFVNGLRINKACELLVHSKMPITDICFKVGFNNIANFNRRFIVVKGMKPSEYRKVSSLTY